MMAIQSMINGFSFYLEKTGYRVSFGIGRAIGGMLIYSAATYIIGILADTIGETAIPLTGITVMALLLAVLSATSATVKKAVSADSQNTEKSVRKQDTISFREFLRNNKMYFIFSLGIAGIYFGHSVQNTFTIQIVTNVGGTSSDMGLLLMCMAFCEIPGSIFFARINRYRSSRTLLKISMAGFVIKMVLIWLSDSVFMLLVAHFFQMFGLGLFMPSIVHFVQEIMDPGEVIRGQAVYPVMVTAATIASSLSGGIIIDKLGMSSLLFICVLFTTAGAGVILIFADKIKRKNDCTN